MRAFIVYAHYLDGIQANQQMPTRSARKLLDKLTKWSNPTEQYSYPTKGWNIYTRDSFSFLKCLFLWGGTEFCTHTHTHKKLGAEIDSSLLRKSLGYLQRGEPTHASQPTHHVFFCLVFPPSRLTHFHRVCTPHRARFICTCIKVENKKSQGKHDRLETGELMARPPAKLNGEKTMSV